MGCIFAELIFLRPIFSEQNSQDQLKTIFNKIGLDDKQIVQMSNYKTQTELKQRQEDKAFWEPYKVELGEEGYELLEKMLKIVPSERISIEEIIYHSFFDELRSPLSLFSN